MSFIFSPVASRLLPGVVASFFVISSALAHGDHTHGQGSARVVVDGQTLTVSLDVPLESFLGFDYPPKGEAQVQTWQALKARLAEPLRFVEPAAEGECTPAGATSKPDLSGDDPGGDLANLVYEVRFSCRKPEALKSVVFSAFRDHPGLKQLRVQATNGTVRKSLTVRPRFPALIF